MKRTIMRRKFKLSPDQGRQLFAALMSDNRIKLELENPNNPPEWRDAIFAEAARRDLLPSNYQI